MMRRLYARFLAIFKRRNDDWQDDPPHDPQRITRLLWGDERMTMGGDR